jgi:hypothetical protein
MFAATYYGMFSLFGAFEKKKKKKKKKGKTPHTLFAVVFWKHKASHEDKQDECNILREILYTLTAVPLFIGRIGKDLKERDTR